MTTFRYSNRQPWIRQKIYSLFANGLIFQLDKFEKRFSNKRDRIDSTRIWSDCWKEYSRENLNSMENNTELCFFRDDPLMEILFHLANRSHYFWSEEWRTKVSMQKRKREGKYFDLIDYEMISTGNTSSLFISKVFFFLHNKDRDFFIEVFPFPQGNLLHWYNTNVIDYTVQSNLLCTHTHASTSVDQASLFSSCSFLLSLFIDHISIIHPLINMALFRILLFLLYSCLTIEGECR